MQKIKEWLISTLGGAGFIVFLLVIAAVNILPMEILDFPLWAVIAVCFVLSFFEWTQFLYLGVWIWAFVVAIGKPLSWFTIVFFIVFAIYFGNIVFSIISAVRNK